MSRFQIWLCRRLFQHAFRGSSWPHSNLKKIFIVMYYQAQFAFPEDNDATRRAWLCETLENTMNFIDSEKQEPA